MAKAKKTEKATESKPESAPVAAKAAPKASAPAVVETPAKAAKAAPKARATKAAPAKPAATFGGSTPMVDTGFAAQAAAKMLAARANGTIGIGNTADRKETSTFKQLKESLAKPHSTSVGNLLNTTSPNEMKKAGQHSHQNKQQGHNQTFGSDASKAFVPRRTGGG